MEHGNSFDGNCDGGSERIEMSGVLNKLSRLERMLETLIGKQLEEGKI